MAIYQFTDLYRTRVRAAWEHFIADGDFDYSVVRPEIFASWKRSKAAGVASNKHRFPLLSHEELNIKINSNLGLIEIARPYMENLYSVVQNSGFYIMLCDKDGYILDLIGDRDMIERGKSLSNLVIGANRSERIAGTNAIGTCLYIRKPIQIWSEEHYYDKHKEYVCSCAPFFDANGNLLGALDITGRHTDAHPHTLGMVISAADGIAKEIKIRKANEDIELISSQRNSIIESGPSGILLLNNSNTVIQINNTALRMLDLTYDNAIGKNLLGLISFELRAASDTPPFNKETLNREINIYIGKTAPPKKYNMSVNFVLDASGRKNGTVLRIDEAKTIHRLANHISGYKAIYTFDSIVGGSELLRDAIKSGKGAAKSESNVLLMGESGTGKELFAHAIHNESASSKGPFVAINCAALPKNLVESELFGYERGAFTGAGSQGSPGKFELADEGSIFLDEIGDMPLEAQASLLRVIETKSIVRIGGKYPKSVNVRIIAATNHNLQELVDSRDFRRDLFYRLDVMSISIPPLRSRGRDVALLADYFVAAYNKSKNRNIRIRPDVYDILFAYAWPGNVRQLENVIERAVNLTETDEIEVRHLPAILLRDRAEPAPAPHSLHAELRNRELFLEALESSNGNVRKAAERLGVNRRTFYRKLEKYAIDITHYR
jgi:transcriptional regulator of acetoin/glycerol metabolism